MSLYSELKRRDVFKVAIAYAVTTWVLLQIAAVLVSYSMLPDWAPKLILLLLAIGFVPALILAWGFELTPDGVRLEKEPPPEAPARRKGGRKLEYLILVSVGLSLGLFIWELRYEQKAAEVASAGITTAKRQPPAATPEPPPVMPTTEIDVNSIAVLPFVNRSAGAEDIYFSDGVHEDLLTQLTRIDALRVISRTSVMEYRNTAKSLREIARELHVANVMEGSVQRAGDRVRINVQLINAANEEHLWADIYDRELTTGNLFDIQSEIARAIAEALKAKLTPSELADVGAVPTDNVDAYDLYLQGRQLTRSETMGDYRAAVGLFGEAVTLDPGFKYAWIALARAHMTNFWVYGGDPADRDLALAAIEQARAIDANFAELFMAEGFYWYWGYLDYERALYKLEKALGLMPGNDEAYMWHGWVSRRAGAWEQARRSMQQALELNPRVHFNWHEYALTLLYMHRYAEANSAAMQARALDPDSFWGRTTLARVALQESGDVETALQMTAGAQHSSDFDIVETYLLTHILAGRFEEALAVARNLADDLEIQRGAIMLREIWAAQILYYLGRHDEAGQAAGAALFRLRGLRNQLGEDYRIDLAEAMVSPIRGAAPAEIRAGVQKSLASKPADAVEQFRFILEYAHIYGMAGMTAEAVEMLETVLQPPSDTSTYKVDLDPAFDGIRDDPAFVALLERYR